MNQVARKVSDEFNLSNSAYLMLSLQIDRTVKGSNEVLVSPIANETSPDDILSGWDNIFNNNLSKMNSTLRELEFSNRSKFGPRSIAKSWLERRDSVLSYFGDSNLGIDLTPPVKPTRRLRPLNYDAAIQYLKNDSNSGLPYLVKKSRIKGSLVSDCKELYSRNYPCVLFTRTQENNKTRTVWGYPASDTLEEMRYYRPLLDYQKKLSWRAALNTPDIIDLAMTKLLVAANNNKDEKLLSIDFSSYDATVKFGLQTAAFNYIRDMYQSQYVSEIDVIAKRFNTVGLVTPDGIYDGPHGVPSGSTFTNEVDSICQYLVASSSNLIDEINLCQIQGDDGVYLTRFPNELMEHFGKYGLDVNIDKSHIANEYIIYLQSLYHIDYMKNGVVGGIYSTYRALLRLVYLERFTDISKDEISGKDYFAIRAISIIENVKHHPLFEQFVLYVLSLDKYNLQFSDQGLKAFVKSRMSKEGKDITFRNWSYGEDVGGIRNFESYKIIQRNI